jgi:hypothetical protein
VAADTSALLGAIFMITDWYHFLPIFWLKEIEAIENQCYFNFSTSIISIYPIFIHFRWNYNKYKWNIILTPETFQYLLFS